MQRRGHARQRVIARSLKYQLRRHRQRKRPSTAKSVHPPNSEVTYDRRIQERALGGLKPSTHRLASHVSRPCCTKGGPSKATFRTCAGPSRPNSSEICAVI